MSLAPELTSFGSGLPSQAADERLRRGRWDLSPDWCCTDLCPREGTNVVRIVFHSCIRRPSRTTRLSFWRASLRGRYGVSVEFPLPSTYPSLVCLRSPESGAFPRWRVSRRGDSSVCPCP